MTIVPIYDNKGLQIDQLNIDDDIQYIDGRVSRGKNCYYKGVGTKYNTQCMIDVTDEYEVISKSDIFYVGYNVVKKCFVDKFGIFQERYQHFFPDFIGACSVKEGPIVLNSTIFEKSSVDVIDYIEFDKENHQSYYKLNYKCNRKTYLNEGKPKNLRELIDYTIKNDWNFLWDKTSIRDISAKGLVTDVADLFVSNELHHKVGSVYSILYSLGRLNNKKYLEFLRYNNLPHIDDRSFVFNAIKLLTMNGIDVSMLVPYQNATQVYQHVILNYIVNGKNCAYCACDMFAPYGEHVKNQYVENAKKQFARVVK